jgi:O-Antigen ligase
VAFVTVSAPAQPISSAPVPAPPPRWLRWWLALLPALYILSPLGLLALPSLRRLPRPVWWLLGFYALSQQLPALLTPEPLLSSVLALLRTAQMFGLIAVGAVLADTRRLRDVRWGLGAVYLTALIYSLTEHLDLYSQRLTHPSMTSITLGLLGACGVWVALFGGGKLLWRIPLGVSALATLLLSGSRGALLAVLVGCTLGWVVRQGGRLALGILAGAALLAGGFYVGQRLALPAITRLSSADASGRDLIWYDTLSVIQSAPVAGVGSYRLGARLATPGAPCKLWLTTVIGFDACPAWVTRLGEPWVIAHNVTLHQLAETGPLGLLGLFLLLGVTGAAACLQRDALAVAVLAGLLAATATDNTLLVPSAGVGELFWITAGCVLVRLPASSPALGWAGGSLAAGLLVVLSFPLLLGPLFPVPARPVTLETLIAPRTVKDTKSYAAYLRLKLPPGLYRLSMRACQRSCATVITIPVRAAENGLTPVIKLGGSLYPVPRQRLELLLYAGESLRPEPLAQTAWTVQWTP